MPNNCAFSIVQKSLQCTFVVFVYVENRAEHWNKEVDYNTIITSKIVMRSSSMNYILVMKLTEVHDLSSRNRGESMYTS